MAVRSCERVGADSPPTNAEWLGATPVARSEAQPVGRYVKRPHYVALRTPAIEERAIHNIPIAVQPGPDQLGAATLVEARNVAWVRHKSRIVAQLRRDEDA